MIAGGAELVVALALGGASMTLIGGALFWDRVMARLRDGPRRVALQREIAARFERWRQATDLGPVEVHLDRDFEGWPIWVLRIAIPPTVRIVPRGWAAALPDRRTGDPAFDERFWIHPVTLAAADLRERLLRLLPDPVTAGDGQLQLVRHVAGADDLPDDDVARLRALRPLLWRSLDEAILHIAESDPVPRIRVRALKALNRRDPIAAAVPIRRALDCAVPEVAIAAAVLAGESGRLERLALGGPILLARQAVAALLELGDDDAVARVVGRRVMRDGPEEIQLLLDTLARRPSAGGVRGIGELYASGRIRTADPNVRQEIAARLRDVAVAAGAHPEVERVLLRVLDEPDAPVRAHAAQALGAVGTVAAVPALLEAENRATLFIGPQVFRTAIEAIQARSGGTRGGLALAEERPGAGALSEAAERGALSER